MIRKKAVKYNTKTETMFSFIFRLSDEAILEFSE